jgi:hypothetical protein
MLADYQAQTQNLLNDAAGQYFATGTLNNYINRARRRVASASGCVRVMPEGMKTLPNQERYHFHHWLPLVQAIPGVREIIAVRTLAIAIGPQPGAWKPAWNYIPWSDFQARFRLWNHMWIGTISAPGFWSQYGFGTNGSIYLAPIPTVISTMELDCSCLPFPLQTDEDPEVIPQPWQDAVPYMSAFFCLMQQQRQQDAQGMLQLFQADLPACASIVAPTTIIAPYGAAVRSA